LKIAISTDGELVSAHFGRCPAFTIVEFESGKVISNGRIDNPGHHPGFLPQFLKEQGVNAIIAGGMGQRAQMLFDENGIKTIVGISGKVDDVAKQAVAGTLQGGESLCKPGAGKGYGLDKTSCEHPQIEECDH
jgi:predicted Fe-Mo cluster-binding NifX family protein